MSGRAAPPAGPPGDPPDRPSGSPASAATPVAKAIPPGFQDFIGTVISERYQILDMVSHGGMGVVFRARHLTLKSVVAVKVLRRRSDAVTQKRFLQEARLASRIKHPNIVFISDFGVLPDGRSYLVMEYLEGPTLSALLKKGLLDPLRACRIALQIARGMKAVHQHGIVHRDLKPQNIFLLDQNGEEDYVKVIDFGIAKNLNDGNVLSATSEAPSSSSQPDVSASGINSELTRAGAFLGSPRYVAPEQVKGSKDVDGRTDQYALGVMLYQRTRTVGNSARSVPRGVALPC